MYLRTTSSPNIVQLETWVYCKTIALQDGTECRCFVPWQEGAKVRQAVLLLKVIHGGLSLVRLCIGLMVTKLARLIMTAVVF